MLSLQRNAQLVSLVEKYKTLLWKEAGMIIFFG